MSSLCVLLDANVLYPAALRSVLVYLATTGLFRARWSVTIHEEWIRSVLAKRPDLTRPQLEQVRDLMIKAIPDSMVFGAEFLVDHIELPDPNDRHVLAAALQGKAERIITFNLKDFPDAALLPYGCLAQHPDDFIVELLEENFALVAATLEKDRQHYLNPPYTLEEYRALLKKQGLLRSVAILDVMEGLL